MSVNLDSIVNVVIDRITKFPNQAGFGTPAVFDINSIQADDVLVVTETSDMIDAGYSTSDTAYKAVNALLSQNPRPQSVKVFKRAANVAQVNTVTVGGNDDGTYTHTINAVDFSFAASGNTDEEIRDGLVSAINGGSEPVTAAPVSTNQYTVTADTAGEGFSSVFSANPSDNLSQVATTANVGAASELARLRDVDDDFYFVIFTDRTPLFVRQIAAAVESLVKLYGFDTDDSDSKDLASSSDTTSLFAVLQAANYDRTFYVWTKTSNLENFPICAWIGRMAPKTPGSATWKFKSTAGPLPDVELTPSEQTNLQNKNANIYVTVAGFNIFAEGVTASGEFVDIIRGTDLIQARIQEQVFFIFVSEDKVPFDNGGIQTIATAVEEVLQNVGVANGILRGGEDAPVVTAPDVSQVPIADRANRVLNGVEFDAFYAGAIHSTNFRGRISV